MRAINFFLIVIFCSNLAFGQLTPSKDDSAEQRSFFSKLRYGFSLDRWGKFDYSLIQVHSGRIDTASSQLAYSFQVGSAFSNPKLEWGFGINHYNSLSSTINTPTLFSFGGSTFIANKVVLDIETDGYNFNLRYIFNPAARRSWFLEGGLYFSEQEMSFGSISRTVNSDEFLAFTVGYQFNYTPNHRLSLSLQALDTSDYFDNTTEFKVSYSYGG